RGYHGESGFTAALNAKGYKYQWKMVLEELRVQVKLAERDPENFELRNDWFNNFSVAAMCIDYIQNLAKHIDSLKIRHCKGVPYVKLQTNDIFVSDLDKKVLDPLKSLAEDIMATEKPSSLHRLVCQFYDLVKKFYFKHNIPMSAAFKDAYKGVGAYFTMKNMILFHGARFKNDCIKLSEEKSLEILNSKNKEYAGEGWRLFGVMKKLIADNNINIEKKMQEWRK
ncbi:MAG: ubiquitin carboxyl-hydrolase, partial [Muribaculum sp.]|nr:ubiquitin carboxyl-hydrolase [Muribaculum sp.]